MSQHVFQSEHSRHVTVKDEDESLQTSDVQTIEVNLRENEYLCTGNVTSPSLVSTGAHE